MKDIHTLLKLNKSGIYAFINPTFKKIYIGYSKNILKSLANKMEEILFSSYSPIKMDYNRDRIDFQVLEEVKGLTSTELKLRTNYWIDCYLSLGYTLYDNCKKPISPSIVKDFSVVLSNGSFDYKVSVSLKDKGNHKKTLGIFPSLHDAEEFIKQYYSEKIYQLVYGSNPESIEYFTIPYKKKV